MTNAEKFLKDGVDAIKPFLDKCREIGAIDSGREFRIDQMLREQVKPTLTEDERVILRNIHKHYTQIKREKGTNNIFVQADSVVSESDWDFLVPFNHLFQFIKEGEEYSIEELLKGD